ncbi:GIY-YIG nuclease family protein [Nonlabens ponticola]|uniref:GIY-YIG nuclease family protein n=2 Tax=Nonlabens ponticola TaxID=2496866 RepID=A0A3S9MX30_9FLAO|nr:GIY-YIG nuclease family protein [Nonlabens ponticola]
MTNKKDGALYIGYTSDIESRVIELKTKLNPKSFTAKYNCDKLVYLEEHHTRATAEKRESQMKKWKREWKIELIEKLNPEWMDVAMNWSTDSHITLKSKRIKASIDYYKDIGNLDVWESTAL